MEMTRILDESPGTPGRRQHMPRTIRSIRTPASLARYSSSIRRRSTRPFILAMIRAGRPARAWAAPDVGPYLLERTGPADIRLLIEARLQLDEDGDLLAVLDGRAQRVGDRRGRAHAVERHLDREDLGIDGGLAHEASDRVEGVVGVMHENVPRADRCPDIERALERRDRLRWHRAVLELGEVEGRVELEQIREGREDFAFVKVLGRELQLVEQGGQNVGWQICVVLEPHGRGEAALAYALFDAGEQILGTAPRVEIFVARDS